MRWNNQDVEEVRNPSPHCAEPIVRPGLFEVPRAGNALKRYPPTTTPLIFYSNGQTLSQPLHHAPLGQVGWHDASVSDGPSTPSRERQHLDVALPGDEHITTDFLASQSLPRSAALKKNNQWRRWSTDVIPQLVPIFIELMHATKCLRDTSGLLLEAVPCTCTKRALYVAILSSTLASPYAPDPRHPGFLSSRGYKLTTKDTLRVRFGNALEWYMSLQHATKAKIDAALDVVRSTLRDKEVTATAQQPTSTSPTPSPAPPTTNPGIPAATRPVPQNPSCAHQKRRRAGDDVEVPNGTLVAHGHQGIVQLTRSELGIDTSEEWRPSRQHLFGGRGVSLLRLCSFPGLWWHESTCFSHPDHFILLYGFRVGTSTTSSSQFHPRDNLYFYNDNNEVAEPTPNPFPTPEPRTSLSDYLISRCPACFGGLVHDRTADVDIHVCADACFTQKRRQKGSRRDPPRSHPCTVFVPEPTANKMSVYVEEVRPPTARAPAKRTRQDEAEDEYEDVTLRVPRSVLDECESSFKAADEKHEKASTKFFDDTGLMGLLCRHDCVLWLVNMRTAGEKQYYVLVLLETLFQHLPSNIRVGVLYDIACQLHRSCVKWGFLDRYMDRIWFAVSVFHSFGHRWSCQLIYHPLKCCGFGHTNGEGCERFWHSISKLIAYLRVSGYHLRLYTIDSQIEHADKMSLGRLASWILRRTAHCEGKLKDVVAELQTCGVAEDVLPAQWVDQVAVQTKPLARRSKTRGLAVVEQVLEARSKVTLLFERMMRMEEALQDDKTPADERLYANMNHADTQKAWKQQKERVAQLERDLGVNHSTALKKLEHSEYYTARMNAKALKERLRAKLCDRKFELDPIERSIRQTASENQRNEHAGQVIKQHGPNISKLMTAYNKSCDDIAKLIAAKKAPRSAVAPAQVAKSLYKLDVNNIIWQDVGLDEDNNNDTARPLWLSDDNIWFAREWKTVCEAIALSDEDSVRYQFELRREELLQLCVLWKKSLDRLGMDQNTLLPEWGPTKEDLLSCEISAVTVSWGDGEEQQAEDDEEDAGTEEEEDNLFQVIAAVERADNHRGGNEGGNVGEDHDVFWDSDED
ncbi:hypothetical protein DFH07DRAFT_766765 [Mycena maculata]|uniref:CxC1-like cysteine cluster associated with KDZ transposases domain-containing protein n=1 Tax=Mycena maculata TaxID=230809 RepID=A0AAD7K241_9AGAR|nr:hypothetical protein DFH07DRAFT_766765 [Mycena maculata]